MELIAANITFLPQDPRSASKILLDKLLNEIHPLMIKTRDRLQLRTEDEEDTSKIRDIYSLCLSQIKKCVLNLFEVFKLEFNSHTLLQETRQCNIDRLSWCFNKLISIGNYLEKRALNDSQSSIENNESFNVNIMYFVNWIDHAFEVLNKLAYVVYKTDYKDTDELFEHWKNDMVECVSGLHLSIDELLLSAMTLCRYCLPSDQHIVKARCQVVLRETKALLTELIEGDLSTTVKATSEALKLPIMPSNVNVMIDVLKDVLYVLETNTNTALLTLLVHCFSNSTSPVDVLKQHFMESSIGMCPCIVKSADEVTEDCSFVKEFDLYNERLLQIGSFAVSCSSDQNRILSLRSGLASLEALDPHLVPALMTSPDGYHSTLLVKSWREEVQEIRDSVFLIVDPAAFADKSKQMMHQRLLEVLKETAYNNITVCPVINIGCVVHDFFNVYIKLEPAALAHREKLSPLLADLNKVQLECKIVSNLLSTTDDVTYDIKIPKEKEASFDQLLKRLKLLYTILTRINTLLQPKETDQLFENETEEMAKNVTHTIFKNGQTYLNSPRKENCTKSIFARTNVRSSTRNVPLAKLTKHLRVKKCTELNFSVELDRLFNLSEDKESVVSNKQLNKVRETSILYNFSPIKNRSSLRKLVLNRHLSTFNKEDRVVDIAAERESLMDENESLQLTEVLNQINDMTNNASRTARRAAFNQTQTKTNSNTLRININNQNTTISKHIWHIPVNASKVDMALDETILTSNVSDVTQHSNVTTMERISDLDFVETKLNSLKSQLETSL